MMRPSSVRVAATIRPRSSRSSAASLSRFLQKKAPSRAESHSATSESARTKIGYLNTWFMLKPPFLCCRIHPESEARKIREGEHESTIANCWSGRDVDDGVVHRANAGTARSESDLRLRRSGKF